MIIKSVFRSNNYWLCKQFISNKISIKDHKLTNKKKETKWFEFDIHSETTVRRVVSFSPEKRKLLQSIVDSTNEGCEIKKSKMGSSDDIIINQHSAIKKLNLASRNMIKTSLFRH